MSDDPKTNEKQSEVGMWVDVLTTRGWLRCWVWKDAPYSTAYLLLMPDAGEC